MKKCNCDVPDGLHATCCGWVNAWVFLDDKGHINDERHPGHGQNYSQWLSQQTTPNPPRNNVEEKFNTYTDQSAYTPSYLLTDTTLSVEKSEGEEAVVIKIGKKLFPGEDISVRQTKKGDWEISYTNDYPMQHGGGEQVIIPKKLIELYSSLLHSSGDRGRKEEE